MRSIYLVSLLLVSQFAAAYGVENPEVATSDNSAIDSNSLAAAQDKKLAEMDNCIAEHLKGNGKLDGCKGKAILSQDGFSKRIEFVKAKQNIELQKTATATYGISITSSCMEQIRRMTGPTHPGMLSACERGLRTLGAIQLPAWNWQK